MFGAGGGGFNSVAAWDVSTGKRQWADKANGDVQAVKFSNGNVYFGFHDGYGGNTTLRLLAADAGTGTVEPAFQPASGGYPGVLALDADGDYLAVGRVKFPKMGGVQREGCVHPPLSGRPRTASCHRCVGLARPDGRAQPRSGRGRPGDARMRWRHGVGLAGRRNRWRWLSYKLRPLPPPR